MTSPSIKVLLVEDDAADARLLQAMLGQVAPGQYALTRAERLGEAFQQLGKEKFDVILTDLQLPDSAGLATFTQLRDRAPALPIVVLTGQGDERIGVSAVQKGAQDYLQKGEVNGPQLARALRFAVERHRQQQAEKQKGVPRGKVTAFWGAKGGVGTTTVALNVAASLAQKKSRVILAELRSSFGTLALLLRQAPLHNLSELLAVGSQADGEREIASRLVAAAGLRILYGPQKPEEYVELDADRAEIVVEQLAGMADHVILDLPAQPSLATLAVLRHCSFVALVVEREPISVAAGKVAMQLLRGANLMGASVGSVVVNRMALAAPMKLTDIRDQLGCEIVGIVPPGMDACLRAQHAGLPFVVSQPANLAATALAEIAGRLAAEQLVSARLE